MRITDRYLLKEFLLTLLGVLTVCIIVLLVYLLLDVFEDIIESRPPFHYVIVYFLNRMPLLLLEVFPLAMAIAALYAISHLARNRELLAFVSSGLSNWRLLLPLMIATLWLSVGLLFFGELVVPKAEERAWLIEETHIKGKGQRVVTRSKDIFFKGPGTWFYHVKGYDAIQKTMWGVNFQELYPNYVAVKQRISAPRAVFKGSGPDGDLWELQQAKRIFYSLQGKVINAEQFSQPLEITLLPVVKDFLIRHKAPEQMNVLELHHYISMLRQIGEPTHIYNTEMHLKLVFPFSLILFVLVGYGFGSRVSHGTYMTNFSLGLGSVVAFYALVALFRSLGHKQLIWGELAGWLPFLLFMLFSGWLIEKYSLS